MADSEEEKRGEKTALYCTDCAEERIFEWATWSGIGFYGYPPASEYGWVCSMCGNRLRVTETPPR
jgi:hypothetical protein